MARKKRFKLVFFVVIGIAAVLALVFASRKIFSDNNIIPQDRLAAVKRGDLVRSVVATGSIIPVTTVELKSKSAGLIKQIMVEEGARIREGQILLELDKEMLQAQLREADANRQAIGARLQEAEATVASEEATKRKLSLDLKNQEETLAFRQKQLDRYRSMSEDKIISRLDLEQVERDSQEAFLKLQAQRADLVMQDSRIEASRKAVARVRAELIQAEATLDRARENLRYATILSPITGVVLKRHVEVGDAVSSILQLGSQATLLMTLGDMSELFVQGRVDESDIGNVFAGQQARIKVDAFRERIFPGKVIRISPLGALKDNVIGFDVRVSIQDKEGILRAKMSANAEIVIEERKGVLTIPENAVNYDVQRKPFAEFPDPAQKGGTRRIPITLGISNGTTTEVTSGLKEGDKVVLKARDII